MSKHNIPFFKKKKENHPKLSQICNYGNLKNEFETAIIEVLLYIEELQTEKHYGLKHSFRNTCNFLSIREM